MILIKPIKYPGGKDDLARRIISLMPPRCKNPNKPDPADKGWLHYVEPYFGGGSVLLANDPTGISEVVGDINSDLTNFWCVLQSAKLFKDFKRLIETVPFSQYEYNWANDYNIVSIDPHQMSVMYAASFFIRSRQSLAGRMDAFTSLSRTRTRRDMNEQVSAWLNSIEGLPLVHKRLKRVVIYTEPALKIINREDGPRTLFYLDPPYMHITRSTFSEYGRFEMTEAQHLALLKRLKKVKGYFMLSGYRSKLYDSFARKEGWKRYGFVVPNNAAGGKEKRRMVECIWTNY